MIQLVKNPFLAKKQLSFYCCRQILVCLDLLYFLLKVHLYYLDEEPDEEIKDLIIYRDEITEKRTPKVKFNLTNKRLFFFLSSILFNSYFAINFKTILLIRFIYIYIWNYKIYYQIYIHNRLKTKYIHIYCKFMSQYLI